MRSLRLGLAVGVMFLLSRPGSAQAGDPVLYGADGAAGNSTTNLYILDPTTGGIVSTVGPIGFAVTGLAIDPITGILYGSTGNNSPTRRGASSRSTRRRALAPFSAP